MDNAVDITGQISPPGGRRRPSRGVLVNHSAIPPTPPAPLLRPIARQRQPPGQTVGAMVVIIVGLTSMNGRPDPAWPLGRGQNTVPRTTPNWTAVV